MALTMKEQYARVDLAKLPENLRKEFEGIKEDSDNFDPELTPIFEKNFKDAYAITENHFPDAIKKGGTIKKVRPVKVKKPVAKSKTEGKLDKWVGKTIMYKTDLAKGYKSLVLEVLPGNFLHLKKLNDGTKFRLKVNDNVEIWEVGTKEMVHKSRGKLKFVPRSRGKKKPIELKGYAKSISEATGVTDPKILDELEDIMRHTIFHSTLDHQTKEIFNKGAREALELYNAIHKTNFKPPAKDDKIYDIEECRKIFSEAGYTIKKKPSKSGTKVMKVKVQRQERTIIKDKVDDTFKTILKDVSGSKEKDEKYLKMQKALSELQELMTKLFNLLNNLAEDNSVEKVEKIISLMKKLVP